MGRACGKHEREEEYIEGFGWKHRRRPLGMLKLWRGNNKMDLAEIG
jgi:hypothetical protein